MKSVEKYRSHIITNRETYYGARQLIYKFPNNYGASVVGYHPLLHMYHFYCEVAVIVFNNQNKWSLCYETPITNDVIVLQEHNELEKLLDLIFVLKPNSNHYTIAVERDNRLFNRNRGVNPIDD